MIIVIGINRSPLCGFTCYILVVTESRRGGRRRRGRRRAADAGSARRTGRAGRALLARGACR